MADVLSSDRTKDLLIYGIISLLQISFPVASVIHFPPIPMSLTINWESQLHLCSSGKPQPKKTTSQNCCLKPLTLDSSVMPALEPHCSLMQPPCTEQQCPSSSPPCPLLMTKQGHSKGSAAWGALASTSTPKSVPVPPSGSIPAALRQIQLDKQGLASSLPSSLHPTPACPLFIKPHKGMEQWGVCPHREHTHWRSTVLLLGSFPLSIGELNQSNL